MIDPNRPSLLHIAGALGTFADEVVFTGGAIVGLLITDPATPRVRPTRDVDSIVEVLSRSDYDHRIRDRLLERGFKELLGDGIPACAWVKDGIRLDVMPTTDEVLGFTNRWFCGAMRTARRVTLDGMSLHVISAPHFLATKLTAFAARGHGDYFASPDVEDVVAILDGRAEIVTDVMSAPSEVRLYLSDRWRRCRYRNCAEYVRPNRSVASTTTDPLASEMSAYSIW